MWDNHSIQLQTINYKKLYIEANTDLQIEKSDSADMNIDGSFQMRTANTTLGDDNLLGVKLSLLVGFNENHDRIDTEPFWLDVELEGIFEVNSDTFPVEQLDSWAKRNAPLILYPYAREVAFNLTSRVLNTTAVVLPLLTVPTIKNDNN